MSPNMSEPVYCDPQPGVITSETRHQYLVRTGKATPRFLQGVFPFLGRGISDLRLLNDALRYRVPAGKSAEVLYFRAGNVSEDLIYLVLSAGGTPIRYFPAGPKADIHVTLAITESHGEGKRLEVGLAAPRGLSGTVVIDVGIVEVQS